MNRRLLSLPALALCLGLASPALASTYTVTLSSEQIEMLDAGMYYVNIHSEDYPGGEIRGQITAQPVAVQEGSWGKVKALD